MSDVSAMEREIRLISHFHTLNLIRILLSILLFLYEFLSAFYGYRTVASLYILIFINLAPWILELFLAPYVKKRPVILPCLRKKYHYSTLRLTTSKISFLITCFLLLLWQGHQSSAVPPFSWFPFVPAALAAGAAFFRVFAPSLITKYIQRNLLSGKM